MPTQENTMIVVGVDGSPTALRAVSWAAREAALRGVGLRVVHAMTAWAQEMPQEGRYADVARWMRDVAESILTQAVEQARQERPEVSLESAAFPGDPRPALIKEAEDADLLVLGNHGLGGFTGLLVGSTAQGVTGRTSCPVVVVREVPSLPRAEMVVGVDCSPAGDAVLRFAFAEAAVRGVELHAVHAWTPRDAGDGSEQAEQGRTVAEALVSWRTRYPDVKVIEHLVQEHPVQALLQVSTGADLLVVGSHGHGGLTGLILGSVSQALLHHAACPMAVIPTRRAGG
jgi:nucleotide-binding universal stress UspA family protein